MKKERLYLLDEKFKPSDLEWRIQQFGISSGKPWARVLCYVTSRAIQNRLDEVCGKSDWSTEIKTVEGSYICKLGINIEGTWVYKEDGAGETKVEAVKGGVSGSIKRAGVQWGIGRYLYDLKENWAVFVEDKNQAEYRYYDKASNKTYYWNAPKLPEWALPKSEEKSVISEKETTETVKINVNSVDYAEKICNLMTKYEMQLAGEPTKLANECLKNKGDYEAMYNRMVVYLGKKGIKVA